MSIRRLFQATGPATQLMPVCYSYNHFNEYECLGRINSQGEKQKRLKAKV